MSWINNIWGKDKENQFKGFSLFCLSIAFVFVIITLFVLRFWGLGEGFPLSPLIYLLSLGLGSCLCALKIWFRLSLLVSCFLFFELFFGYGGLVLTKVGVNGLRSFLPVSNHNQFVFHPALGAIPNPTFSNQSISHTPEGLRATATEFNLSLPHIAVFGGSTTYDIGVTSNNKTWVSVLNETLDGFSLSNNGVPGYSTAEHVAQTAFYANRAGAMPICSIYYIGWNDIRNFGFSELDSGYSRFHIPSQYGNLRVRYSLNSFSPTINLLSSFVLRSELPFPIIRGELGKDVTLEDGMFEISENNLRTISALNRSRGTKTVFIPQMLNRAELTDSTRSYGWLPFVYDADVWPLQERFNVMVGELAGSLGDYYIDPDINSFISFDFADNGHFNDVGAAKMASAIANDVETVCSGN
jgi:hypothetical protein